MLKHNSLGPSDHIMTTIEVLFCILMGIKDMLIIKNYRHREYLISLMLIFTFLFITALNIRIWPLICFGVMENLMKLFHFAINKVKYLHIIVCDKHI